MKGRTMHALVLAIGLSLVAASTLAPNSMVKATATTLQLPPTCLVTITLVEAVVHADNENGEDEYYFGAVAVGESFVIRGGGRIPPKGEPSFVVPPDQPPPSGSYTISINQMVFRFPVRPREDPPEFTINGFAYEEDGFLRGEDDGAFNAALVPAPGGCGGSANVPVRANLVFQGNPPVDVTLVFEVTWS